MVLSKFVDAYWARSQSSERSVLDCVIFLAAEGTAELASTKLLEPTAMIHLKLDDFPQIGYKLLLVN